MTTATTTAQAHALRAAARFIEDAGMPHLTVIVHGNGTISINVEEGAGPAGARAEAVALLAARTGAGRLTRTSHGSWSWAGSSGSGRVGGHDVRIGTYISGQDQR